MGEERDRGRERETAEEWKSLYLSPFSDTLFPPLNRTLPNYAAGPGAGHIRGAQGGRSGWTEGDGQGAECCTPGCAGGLRKSSPQAGVVRGIQSYFTGGENGARERRASFPWRALGAQPSCKPDRGARPFLGGRAASNPGALWVPVMVGE